MDMKNLFAHWILLSIMKQWIDSHFKFSLSSLNCRCPCSCYYLGFHVWESIYELSLPFSWQLGNTVCLFLQSSSTWVLFDLQWTWYLQSCWHGTFFYPFWSGSLLPMASCQRAYQIHLQWNFASWIILLVKSCFSV